MRFVMLDGNVITGRSYSDVVFRMSQEKMREPRSMRSYRRATARRVKEAYGVSIDHETDRQFILDMEAAGLVGRA